MTREEMLDKLHKIRVGAQPTVATMDMGLEYEYVTPDGYGDCFGGMGDWPVYRLENISEQSFQKIKTKLKDKTLMLADLEGTDLFQFYNHVFRVNRPEEYIRKPLEFFKELESISFIENGICYALCDALDWEPMYRYSMCGNTDELQRLHLLDCMECGCCAFTCPGKLPLVEQFRKGKGMLRAAMAEKKAKEEKK